MVDKKRLGRGLNEISHLFISSKEEKRGAQVACLAPHPIVRTPRSFTVLSLIPYPSGPFLVSLALSLSFHRARVLLVDFKGQEPDLGTLMGFPKLAPSIRDYLEVEERPFLLQCSSLIKVLAFHLKGTDLNNLPYHEREILFQVLLQEEFSSDYVLVNIPFQRKKGALLGLNWVHDLLIFTSPNPNSILDTYRIIKQVLQANETLHIGVLFSEPKKGENTLEAFQQLTGGAKKFLGTSMSYLGTLPPLHKIINQTPKDLTRISENSCEDFIPESLCDLGEKIIKGEGFNPYITPPPFFEKVFNQAMV